MLSIPPWKLFCNDLLTRIGFNPIAIESRLRWLPARVKTKGYES